MRFGKGTNLFSLPGSYEVFGVRARARAEHRADYDRTGGSSQCREFSNVVRIDGMPDTDADENGALTAPRAFK